MVKRIATCSRNWLPLAVALLVLSGCATVPHGARLTKAEVIRLADAEARRQGYDLREYQRPQAHYNYVRADDTWFVSYDQIYINGMGEVGKHFMVTVEDKTKKIYFGHGR